MPGDFTRSSCQAPCRKMRPPMTKIARPKAAGMNWLPGKRGPESPRMSCSPVEKTRVGMVRTSVIQNSRLNRAGSWALCS